MSEFDVEIVGSSPADMAERLESINLSARNRTNKALMEAADEVKKDLEDTSPVDTGEYRKSWYIWPAKSNEVWILNEAEHAKFVILPNSVMIGSSKADLPSQGILHNVKGVAKKHDKSVRGNVIDELKEMIRKFKIK